MAFPKISAAGFAATALTFGPARMGFGLFLPELRSDLAMSNGTAGLISGLGFFGFFLGLVAAYALTARHGPRLPVVTGLIAASAGMAIAAAAPTLPVLASGVFLAMSSAGFCWSPFNNTVHRTLSDPERPGALSAVSTGTALGVASVGAVALALSLGGFSWRAGWAGFAVLAALAALGNRAALRDVAGSPGPPSRQPWRTLLKPAALPLHGIALSFGVTSALFISFAAERVEATGGLPGVADGAAPALVFVSYGLFGLTGLLTSRVKAAIGLSWLLRLLMAVSAVSMLLVALVPASPWALVSAALQGLFVMMMSAVLAFWSEELFPQLPSLGFTAALLAVAAGNVIGPAVGGAMSDALGSGALFMGAAAVSAMTAVALLPRDVRERAAPA